MLKVAVIGTGPSALLAAWGVLQEVQATVTFYKPPGVPVISQIHGAQYVHGIIQDLPGEIQPFWLRYRHFGTEEGYRLKIYGVNGVAEGDTSWRKFEEKELAWPIREVYAYLVGELLNSGQCPVVEQGIREYDCEVLVDHNDYVLNTAPLNKIAPGGTYYSEKVLIAPTNELIVPNNEIWYIGDGRLAYRASNIGGHVSTEYPMHAGPNLRPRIRKQTKEISKPLRCEGVELEGVYRLGRYGKWQKGVLVHHVYEEARQIVKLGLPWTASLPG
jgi:hypothetical protein